MNLIFLGTSAATPTKDRNLPSIALRLDNGELILFDAGEDVQRRFEAAKLRFNVPTVILISHMHGDHIIGLLGLLFNFHLNDRTAPLMIIGPQGLAGYLLAQYQYIALKAQTYPLTVLEIEISNPQKIEDEKPAISSTQEDKSPIFTLIEYSNFLTPRFERKFSSLKSNLIFDTPEYGIYAYWVQHSVPTLGFRFEEKPLDGKFNPDRANELKIPMGSLWKKMQEGQQIILKDGRTIDPVKEGIVTEKRPGRIISYSADSGICQNLELLAQDADVFMCEATYNVEDEQLAIEKQHLSTRMAAAIANNAQVNTLILTHFSSRYKDIKELEKEAQSIFKNTIAAEDLLSFEIKINSKKKKKGLS